jgi:inhibitor of the pro-sigma K processing machinery
LNVDYRVIFAYIAGIIFLYILGRFLLVPMKVVAKLIYSALIGGILLLIINFAGESFGFHIAFNVITALIAGFLGVPGIILLVVMKYMFGA